jgi:predicted TIM-barrel fold metal-dependent hydrolase
MSEFTMDDMILVSVDDHVNEPAEMFRNFISPKFKGREPKVVATLHGRAWEIEGKVAGGLGLNAVVGRPKTEYGHEPMNYDQMRRGCWDIQARIDDMNVNGILGALCFPQFPGFGGQRFLNLNDKELANATIQAYNDWHFHDWVSAYPDRLIPLALLPLWDMSLLLAELRRVSKLGVHAVTFSDNPAMLGLPSIHDEYWEPFWKACVDLDIVVCCHIGSGAFAPHASDQSPIASWITSMPMSIAASAADWVFASFWKRHPKLKMCLSEGGIGWIPYFLERADFTFQHHEAWTNLDLGGQKPSELFREHFICCFIEDEFGLNNLEYIGEDIVCWECDYPHSDCTWPNTPEGVWRGLKNLPKSTIDKITHLNAMREFRFDPFAKAKPADCTVGALRERARHVDTSEKGYMGGQDPRFDHTRPVTSGDIKKILSSV